MWPFGKKKKEKPVVGAKFVLGDDVYFMRRGEKTYGRIYRVFTGEDGEILYDVQVAGQCPYFLYGMKEEAFTLNKLN